MKKNIHPKIKYIKTIMTDGSLKYFKFTEVKTKKNTILLDTDLFNHSVWNKNQQITRLDHNVQVSRFKKRFNNFKIIN